MIGTIWTHWQTIYSLFHDWLSNAILQKKVGPTDMFFMIPYPTRFHIKSGTIWHALVAGFYTLFSNTWDELPTLAVPGWDVLGTTWDVYIFVITTKTSHPGCARVGHFDNNLGRLLSGIVVTTWLSNITVVCNTCCCNKQHILVIMSNTKTMN